MGTISHDALIVSGWESSAVETAHKAAMEVAAAMVEEHDPHHTDWTQLIGPVQSGVMNGYCFFFVAPDGSKEWWGHSDQGDQLREQIIEAVRDVQVVKVRWGELGDEVEVVSTWKD